MNSGGTDTSVRANADASRSGHSSRASRFDRQPEPHDWRWVVGGIGRVLIAVGVLMFGFVAYQLWGTGIQTAQAQNRLAAEFDDLIAGQPITSTPTSEGTSTPTSEGTPEGTSESTEPGTTEPGPASTVSPASVPAPMEGDPLARLEIAAIGVDWTVIEGIRPSDLEDGPGHFPETPLPGQLGNAAIAGHRTTHGQPFIRIDELRSGDEIVVTTLAGRYVYLVTGTTIVSPADYQAVIPTIDPTMATLTLTSCHPKYSAQQRIVIASALDVDQSSPLTVTTETTQTSETTETSELPTDASTPADTQPGNTEPTGTQPANTEPGNTQPGNTQPGNTEPAGTPPVAGQDLFENRWFSDPDAFGQVALWGTLLTIVSLAAWAISRRARRNWIGGLVGVVPFVIVLYFFFENVNRLLPPNL